MAHDSNSDLYLRLKFSEEQLSAFREFYFSEVDMFVPSYNDFVGYGHAIHWETDTSLIDLYKRVAARDYLRWIYLPNMSESTVWSNFDKLLPYMSKMCTLSKMPGNSSIGLHVDRKYRPPAIYFPIEGCNSKCISRVWRKGSGDPVEYSIADNAYLQDVTLLHSIYNFNAEPRIAFGWNFKDTSISYADASDILRKLGYA